VTGIGTVASDCRESRFELLRSRSVCRRVSARRKTSCTRTSTLVDRHTLEQDCVNDRRIEVVKLFKGGTSCAAHAHKGRIVVVICGPPMSLGIRKHDERNDKWTRVAARRQSSPDDGREFRLIVNRRRSPAGRANVLDLKEVGRVAQLVEQCPFKAWVAGSNPAALTKISKYLADFGRVGFGHPQTPRASETPVSTQLP
jgi:hypothetical protein